jgi:glycosyltransferase involved in cell wall biosynthesis
VSSAPQRVSVVTISFNQAPYLEECLLSVLSQEANEVEYIVVDPGSSDTSRDILARYADRIDAQILEPDHGPADGLNRGFAAATGEIFGYINADDRYAPGAIEFARRYFADNPNVDVLSGAIRIIDRNGRASLRSRTSDAFNLANYATATCTIGQQGTFFRRAAFERAGGFNPGNRINWDGELLVDMALSGARFDTTTKVLGDFRIYAESITGSKLHMGRLLREHERIAEKIRARGIPLYSPLQAALRRFVYKANVARHIGYLLAE